MRSIICRIQTGSRRDRYSRSGAARPPRDRTVELIGATVEITDWSRDHAFMGRHRRIRHDQAVSAEAPRVSNGCELVEAAPAIAISTACRRDIACEVFGDELAGEPGAP